MATLQAPARQRDDTSQALHAWVVALRDLAERNQLEARPYVLAALLGSQHMSSNLDDETLEEASIALTTLLGQNDESRTAAVEGGAVEQSLALLTERGLVSGRSTVGAHILSFLAMTPMGCVKLQQLDGVGPLTAVLTHGDASGAGHAAATLRTLAERGPSCRAAIRAFEPCIPAVVYLVDGANDWTAAAGAAGGVLFALLAEEPSRVIEAVAHAAQTTPQLGAAMAAHSPALHKTVQKACRERVHEAQGGTDHAVLKEALAFGRAMQLGKNLLGSARNQFKETQDTIADRKKRPWLYAHDEGWRQASPPRAASPRPGSMSSAWSTVTAPRLVAQRDSGKSLVGASLPADMARQASPRHGSQSSPRLSTSPRATRPAASPSMSPPAWGAGMSSGLSHTEPVLKAPAPVSLPHDSGPSAEERVVAHVSGLRNAFDELMALRTERDSEMAQVRDD